MVVFSYEKDNANELKLGGIRNSFKSVVSDVLIKMHGTRFSEPFMENNSLVFNMLQLGKRHCEFIWQREGILFPKYVELTNFVKLYRLFLFLSLKL